MRKKAVQFGVLVLCMIGLPCAAALATGLPDIGVVAAFPTGWAVVTPETVDRHLGYFSEDTPEMAAAFMRAEGVFAQAFSPEGDVVLRVMAQEGDANAQLYHDIERYSPAMRTAIKDSFLNKDAWAVTGYRFTEATWTNREDQGRMLQLTYSVRFGEEIIARGRQAYTIRNGLAFTLDMRVDGRQVTTADEKIFAAFITDTMLPKSEEMPLLPVGLDMTDIVPEETHKAEMTLRGETTKGATVEAWIFPVEGAPYVLGEGKANNSGVFKLEVTLPDQGEWRISLRTSLEGYAPCEENFWVDYNAKRLPVTFSSLPSGYVYDSQIIISGKTIAGVTIQCMEGDTNKKVTTGSDGKFSFKIDRTQTGERKVVLSLTKKNYDNRRFDITFNRQWEREDYVKHLQSQVQSLSFANLTEKPEKYIGRLVKYEGTVLDVSRADDRIYVQLGIKQDKDGRWTERIIGVSDGVEVLLNAGDTAALFFEVTGESYTFSDVTADGDLVDIELPSVKLLTYDKLK